jgi:hypothetical protein
MNNQELTKEFQRCSKCGRWEPKNYLNNEQKHVCPINKNEWVPKRFTDGKHIYE